MFSNNEDNYLIEKQGEIVPKKHGLGSAMSQLQFLVCHF